MDQIQEFVFEGHGVRTVIFNEEPWFVAKDVAEVLGYVNTTDAITAHCKGVAKRYPLQTAGGIQETRIIHEADVWRLVMHSKLPGAQKFENWIMEEVIPSIRKNGGYLSPTVDFSDPDNIQKILHAKEVVQDKFAFLLPLTYLQGSYRYNNIWVDQDFPLASIWVFNRFPMLGVPLREDGLFPTGMQAMAWFLWERTYTGEPTIHWLDIDKYILKKEHKDE